MILFLQVEPGSVGMKSITRAGPSIHPWRGGLSHCAYQFRSCTPLSIQHTLVLTLSAHFHSLIFSIGGHVRLPESSLDLALSLIQSSYAWEITEL